MRRVLLSLALALSAAPAAALTRAPEAEAAICDASAREAAPGGAPVEVLRALTRTETGRRLSGALRPWPWTVNMEGEGFWFDTREEALAFVKKRHAKGARSFDIGCFQINFRWHGEAFESIEAMFDPALNAAYAVRFLNELRAEGGGWREAVGRYHSRTPRYANRYKARFDDILASLGPAPEFSLAELSPAPAPAPARRKRERGKSAWPLLFTNGESEGRGALFVAAPAHGEARRAASSPGLLAGRGGAGRGLLRSAKPLFGE